MQKILIIQTAFIGDVVLSTALVEKMHRYYPSANIDMLVRKGNEGLLQNNPHLHTVMVWDKKQHKTKNLFKLLKTIRSERYDLILNLQRFFSTGFLTAFSNAKETRGFTKNPLSFLFSKKYVHGLAIDKPSKHEVERNNQLIEDITDAKIEKPKLYPSIADEDAVAKYKEQKYVTLSPSSVWFSKKLPVEKWIKIIASIPDSYNGYLLGGPDNVEECDMIKEAANNPNVTILAGVLSFLQSAALMKNATMNYVNDSAPLHFASAMNAPQTAFFCSTLPSFGYTPLSDISFILEKDDPLYCRPCGLHGKRECPEKHFRCGHEIDEEKALQILLNADANI